MKYSGIILLFILMFSLTSSFAADNNSLTQENAENLIAFGAMAFILLLFIIVMVIMLGTLKVLTRIIFKSEGYTEKPVAAEAKPPIITKNTNWFMAFLVPTVGVMGIYLLINYFSGTSQLQTYKSAEESAKTNTTQKITPFTANVIDENSVKLVISQAMLDSGKAVFQQKCAACHGDKGQGVVGPNLTDDYWLHGGTISDVFKTIKYGVPEKAMPAWDKQLTAQNISDVANFIKSIHGTNPAGAKTPQGIKEKFN